MTEKLKRPNAGGRYYRVNGELIPEAVYLANRKADKAPTKPNKRGDQ